MFAKVDQYFGPPKGDPKITPGGEAKELPDTSEELPKASQGHQFYIFKLPINRKAAAARVQEQLCADSTGRGRGRRGKD